MFEQIEKGWQEERQRATRWTVYRMWIGSAIILLAVSMIWLEKMAK